MKCFHCARLKPAALLLAFWPVDDPGRLHYVCRPSLRGPYEPACFAAVVGTKDVHEIALADPELAAVAVPLDERGPAIPGTTAWDALMDACHIPARAA